MEANRSLATEGGHDPTPSVACQLAMRARSGDPGHFDELHAYLTPSLIAWAQMPLHRHIHEVMEAEDFVQELWIRASRHLDSFDASRGTFRQWIFKIAKNSSIDLLRQWARREGQGGGQPRGGSTLNNLLGAKTSGEPSTWRQVARSEALATFVQRVAELPHEEQVLLTQCGIEEQPVAQVAERLEISEAAAHKRWQRLRARLAAERMPEGIVEPLT